MQANTPETLELKIKEKIIFNGKPTRINPVGWGSYNYLTSKGHSKGIAEPGDYIIPKVGYKIDDDTYAIIIKVVKAEDNS